MRPAPRKQLGKFKVKGSGLYRLTVRHGLSYGTFLRLPNRAGRSVYRAADVIGSGSTKHGS